ncbi:MAG: flagellar biosynthetic protein FliR [Nitrospiria bacterium]
MPIVETILRNEAAFLFVLVRVASFMVAIPLMGGEGVPNMVKALIVFSLSVILFQSLTQNKTIDLQSMTIVSLTAGLLGEVMIGLVIGLGVRMFFGAVSIGSEIIGIQMGFGAATLFDPVSNQQASVIAQFQGLIAMLIFLSINGHYFLIEALIKSFEWVPSVGFYPSKEIINQLLRLGSGMFILGLKIGFPVILALLMTNIAIGVLARVVPTMNVLLFSFPVTISLGLLVMGASIPFFVSLLRGEISGFKTLFPQLLMGMKG